MDEVHLHVVHETDILLAAARGNLTRYHTQQGWVYCINHRQTSKRPILDLMRRGLLLPQNRVNLPYISELVEITVKGREALLLREVTQR